MLLPFLQSHRIRREAMAKLRGTIDKHVPPRAPVHYAISPSSTFPGRRHRTARYPCQQQSSHLHNESENCSISITVLMPMNANYRYLVNLDFADLTSDQRARRTVPISNKLDMKELRFENELVTQPDAQLTSGVPVCISHHVIERIRSIAMIIIFAPCFNGVNFYSCQC